MATLIIPTPLRKFTGEQATFSITAKTVKEAILDVVRQFPALRNHLFDDKEDFKSFVRIYVGDEDIKVLQQGATPVEQGAIISLIPAIAGG